MARPRNPDQAAAFAQLREQYPTGALLKVYRTHADGRLPEWIANPQGGTFHAASWDDVSQLESWLLAHPQCGPGTYKVQVYTQDDNGKPSKSAVYTLSPPMIQSPASIAAAQLPTRLAEAQAATQLHATAVAAEAERLHVALVAEAPKVAAEMEQAMSSPDPAVQAAAMAQAANFQAQMKATADNLAASTQALAASMRGVQALGGATPVPQPNAAPPPGVFAGGYIPPPGMQVVGGTPMGAPGMGAPGMGAATPTPMGLFVPGYGVIPWAALQGGNAGVGGMGFNFGAPPAPAARTPDPAIAALEARLAEAEKRAAAAEQRAALEAERARHDAAIAQQQRQNDERLAQLQRDQQAALDRQATELRGQIATMQAQAQAAQTLQQQIAARPTDNTMAMMMPLFQQMQAQAQAAQQQMLAVLANTKNDDASLQVRQAAGAMGEVIQTSMQAVSQMMRMQVAPQGATQPAWLSMAMRAIDTIGGMGAAMLTPTQQPQQVIVQQAPQGYGPPPAQLPPAQVPQQQMPGIPSNGVALPPGAPAPQAPQAPVVAAPAAPGAAAQAQAEAISANPEVVQAIAQARADLAAHRFTSGIAALQRAYDLDAELVRVGESYVTATERLLAGHVHREVLDQLKLNVGKFPGMSDVRQPGQPWPAEAPASPPAPAPAAAPSNVIALNPPAPVQA